jgi:hypothetical protein
MVRRARSRSKSNSTSLLAATACSRIEAAVRGALEIGPVSRSLEGQPPEVMATVANAIRTAYAPLAKGESVPLGGSVWIVTAASV